ncbi:alpha/beta hydrolase [Vallitalea guaymasensis]|uniref:DUF3887 domain-containing protein n=1 Tax=Vallitalea guaymasensis TaxID=1185412 RepID=A0A8J8MBV6_9FIRM|nr:DUF3887 domain-containing protein [Vallitalea guaymasensis]QUH30042.1 DUF3887 domain-containing protein [Vallitalea guaymasensis]
MKRFIISLTIIAMILVGCKGTEQQNNEDAQNVINDEQEAKDDTTDEGQSDNDVLVDGTEEEIATSLNKAFMDKNFEFVSNNFNYSAQLKQMVNVKMLKSADSQINNLAGEFEKVLSTQVVEQDNNKIVIITNKYSKSNINCTVSFNKDKVIEGFSLTPAQDVEEVSVPENVKEIAVEFGEEEYRLPGLLTIPKDKDEYPVVILVHGSGPNDKDETVGPNKPFRDIAYGLASKGIGVLRYDKRVFAHRDKWISEQEELTVYDETIDDVVYAYDYILDNKDINASGVYVLGHSLSGYLMPRIANEIPDASGYIVFAGPSRPMEDLLVYQIPYLSNLDGKITDEEQQQIDYYQSVYDKVKNIDESSNYTTADLGGVGKAYYLDLKDYKPAIVAKDITKPMLFLQGKRDYQVTLEDFNMWKESLESKDNVTMKLYDGLNHLFMKGEGTPNPDEYFVPSRVDDKVIRDISEWISSN